jgi:hypothetical protein
VAAVKLLHLRFGEALTAEAAFATLKRGRIVPIVGMIPVGGNVSIPG